jgi:hypothetical protein
MRSRRTRNCSGNGIVKERAGSITIRRMAMTMTPVMTETRGLGNRMWVVTAVKV